MELGRHGFSMELFSPHVKFVGAFQRCPLLRSVPVHHYCIHATGRLPISWLLSLVNG